MADRGSFTLESHLPNTPGGSTVAGLAVGDTARVGAHEYYCANATDGQAEWILRPPEAEAATTATTATNATSFEVTTGNLTVTLGDAIVSAGDLTVTAGDATVTAGNLTVTAGDLDAAGGHRTLLGPFKVTLAAGQTGTNVPIQGAALAFEAMRAGSVVAMRARVDSAITGASQQVNVFAVVNGTQIAASQLDFTQAGAEVTGLYTTAKDTSLHTFTAGQEITVEYDSDTITNTPELEVWLEIEQ